MSPSINSARPDHLRRYSEDLTRAVGRAGDLSDQVSRALSVYRRTCLDAQAGIRAPWLAETVLSAGRGLARATAQVGEAFDLADHAHGRIWPAMPITEDASRATAVDELALTSIILTHFPGLADGELLRPVTESRQAGTSAGDRAAGLARRGRQAELLDVLNQISGRQITDPAFAVSFLNRFSSSDLTTAVDLLTEGAAESRSTIIDAHRALTTLAGLHATATRGLDQPTLPWSLDHTLVDGLLGTAEGRDAIRVLAGMSPKPLGTTYLHLVIPATLLDRSAAQENHRFPTDTSRWIATRGGNGDVLMFTAIARNRQVTMDLLTRPPDEKMVARLLDRARGVAQDQFAVMVNTALTAPELAHDFHGFGPQARTDLLVDLVGAVREGVPGGLRTPFAVAMAAIVARDPVHLEAYPYSSVSHKLLDFFEPLVAHEEAFLVALEGFDREFSARIAATLHDDHPTRRRAFIDLKVVLRRFIEASLAADLGEAQTNRLLEVARPALDAGVTLITVRGGPAAQLVLKQMAGRAMDEAERRTAIPPGDRASRAEAREAGLRRQLWSILAADPRLSSQLRYGADAGPRSQIAGPDELAAPGPSAADDQMVLTWGRGQTPELQHLVDEYVTLLDLDR